MSRSEASKEAVRVPRETPRARYASHRTTLAASPALFYVIAFGFGEGTGSALFAAAGGGLSPPLGPHKTHDGDVVSAYLARLTHSVALCGAPQPQVCDTD